MGKTIAAVLAIAAATGTAAAENQQLEIRKEPPRRHLIVAELFGKLGLYSLGYELQVTEHISAGAAAAGWIASGRRVAAASAYLGLGGAIAGPHRWLVQLGPELVIEREPAVPGFDGATATAIGGQLGAGYEHRRGRWLVRGLAVLTFGRGGVVPWAGASVGLRF